MRRIRAFIAGSYRTRRLLSKLPDVLLAMAIGIVLGATLALSL